MFKDPLPFGKIVKPQTLNPKLHREQRLDGGEVRATEVSDAKGVLGS